MNKLSYDFLVYEMRRDELIRDAQHRRLVKEAMKAKAQQVYYASFLAAVGSQLIRIGNALERRYKQCAQVEEFQKGVQKGYQV